MRGHLNTHVLAILYSVVRYDMMVWNSMVYGMLKCGMVRGHLNTHVLAILYSMV